MKIFLYLLFLFLFLFSTIGWAFDPCKSVFEKDVTPELFNQEKPIILKANGKEYPISFSSDSEVSWDKIAIYLHQHLDVLNKLKSEGKIPQIEGSKIANYLNKQPSQIISPFVLRKGVRPNQKKYFLTDLNPKYFDQALESMPNSHGTYEKNFFVTEAPELPEIIASTLRAENIPVKGIYDIGYMEFMHESFETSPKGFNSFLKEKLHKIFPTASSHLHVGIPADVVSNTQFLSIARAVEMKAIFRRAMIDFELLGELKFKDSVLLDVKANKRPDGKDFVGYRGIIRAQTSEWSVPFRTHNLELRNYANLNEGLDLISLAVQMASQAKKIKYHHIPQKLVIDPFTLNLSGALLYGAKVLKHSSIPSRQKLGQEMQLLADETNLNPNEISVATRKKVQTFLIENKIDDIFDANAFF